MASSFSSQEEETIIRSRNILTVTQERFFFVPPYSYFLGLPNYRRDVDMLLACAGSNQSEESTYSYKQH